VMNEVTQTESRTIPQAVRTDISRLQETVEREQLPRSVRQAVIVAVRRAVLPRQGRRTDPHIDAACADYQAGMRGLELFRKHIPAHNAMSRYRRLAEERRLMNNIHQRFCRERKAARKPPTSQRPKNALG